MQQKDSSVFRFSDMRKVVSDLPTPVESSKIRLSRRNLYRSNALKKARNAVFSSFQDFSVDAEDSESLSFYKLQEELENNLLADLEAPEHLNIVKLVSSLVIPFFMEGIEDMVDDSFTKCFQRKKEVPWNWNFYLFLP